MGFVWEGEWWVVDLLYLLMYFILFIYLAFASYGGLNGEMREVLSCNGGLAAGY